MNMTVLWRTLVHFNSFDGLLFTTVLSAQGSSSIFAARQVTQSPPEQSWLNQYPSAGNKITIIRWFIHIFVWPQPTYTQVTKISNLLHRFFFKLDTSDELLIKDRSTTQKHSKSN